MTRHEIATLGTIALAKLAAEHGADNNFQAWEVADRIRGGMTAMTVGRFASDIARKASAALGSDVTTGKSPTGQRWFQVLPDAQDRCDEIAREASHVARV